MSNRLSVTLDQQPLPPEQVRDVWERFSAYMDEHRGDFDGFAKSEGFASARVAANNGVATLMLSSVAQAQPSPPTGSGKPPKKRARKRQPAASPRGAGSGPPPKAGARKRRRRRGGTRGQPQADGAAPAGSPKPNPARAATTKKAEDKKAKDKKAKDKKAKDKKAKDKKAKRRGRPSGASTQGAPPKRDAPPDES